MTEDQIRHWTETVWAHQSAGQAMPRITESQPDLTLEDAYQIQQQVIARRLAAGDTLVGYKMGLTSEAKQRGVGVSVPIYGRLTQEMELAHPEIRWAGLIHPRVEPEIAVILKRSLRGEVALREVLTAIDCVMPAWEVIDSRYQHFSFTAADVIADNASSAQFYLAPWAFSPYGRDWSTIGVTVRQNGEIRQMATTAAVLGHPLEAVRRLSAMLDEVGIGLEAGQVILTGGITDALALNEGDRVQMTFGTLGVLDVIIPPKMEG